VDCGNGVIETTYVMFNMDVPGAETWTYSNVPWGGVRTSVLPDVHVADRSSGSTQVEPINGWGIAPLFLPNLKTTGGYTAFSEDLPLLQQWPPRCAKTNGGGAAECTAADTAEVVNRMASNNACAQDTARTANWFKYTVKCTIQATVAHTTRFDEVVTFSNNAGVKFTVNGILFLSQSGNTFIFWPDKLTAAEISALFSAGEKVTIQYEDNGKPLDGQRALTFIHGVDKEATNSKWTSGDHRFWYGDSRMRLGKGGDVVRDYTVYTVNVFIRLPPAQRFWKREYLMVDKLTDTDAHAREWVDEVEQGLYVNGDVQGRFVDLYSQDAHSFGAELNASTTHHQYGNVRCTGRTAPFDGLSGVFAVRCGDTHYVGTDMYHFTPTDPASTAYVRPYRCLESSTVRPSWTLLGFFKPGDCNYLRNARYDASFMTKNNAYPSSAPSNEPTGQPSAVPTSVPTPHPTYEVVVEIAIPVTQRLTTSESPAQFLANTLAVAGFRDGVVAGLNSQGNNPITGLPYSASNVIVNSVTQASSNRRSLFELTSFRRLAASLVVDYSIKFDVKNVDSTAYKASSGFASVFADVTTKVSNPAVSSAVTSQVSSAGSIVVTAANAVPPSSVAAVTSVTRSSSPAPTAIPTAMTQEEKKELPFAIFGGLAAGVVVLCSAAGYWLHGRSHSKVHNDRK